MVLRCLVANLYGVTGCSFSSHCRHAFQRFCECVYLGLPVHSANAGLHIIHDLLLPIKKKYPQVSYGDLWALAGASAVEFAGGPDIPLSLGRVDTTPQEAAQTGLSSRETGTDMPW